MQKKSFLSLLVPFSLLFLFFQYTHGSQLQIEDFAQRSPPRRVMVAARKLDSSEARLECGDTAKTCLMQWLKCCVSNEVKDDRPQFVQEGNSFIWAPHGVKKMMLPPCWVCCPCFCGCIVGYALNAMWIAGNQYKHRSLGNEFSQAVLQSVSNPDESLGVVPAKKIFLSDSGSVNVDGVKGWVNSHGGWKRDLISVQPQVDRTAATSRTPLLNPSQ